MAEGVVHLTTGGGQPNGPATGIGIWTFDIASGAISWCDATRAIHEVPSDFAPTRRTALEFYPGAARLELRLSVARCATNGTPFAMELPFRTWPRRATRVRVTGRALRQHGERRVIVGTIEEIERSSIDAAPSDRALSREILDAMPSGVVVFDQNDNYVLHNESYTEIFPGLKPVLKPGTTLTRMLAHGVDTGEYATEISPFAPRADKLRWVSERAAMIRAAKGSREVPLGQERWIQTRERRSASGYLVCVRTDITRLKRAEAEARRLAEEDELTGLPNRRILFERLDACIHRRRKDDQGGAFGLFDLDRFKQLNDDHGHAFGDAVLREIARRAAGAVRAGDTVARLGGDEFALILPGLLDKSQADRFLARFFDRVRQPIAHHGTTITPSISLGIVFYPIEGQTPESLYRAADTALYAAKRNGRDGWAFDGDKNARTDSPPG